MRTVVALVLLLALSAPLAVPASASAQGDDAAPTELWKEYPLDETAPATPPDAAEAEGAAPQARPVPAGEEDGGGVSRLVLLGLALLALLAAAALLRLRSRRRQPAPVNRAPGNPAPAPSLSVPATNGSAGRPALGYTTVPAAGEAERARVREEAKLIQAACQEHGLVLGKLVRDLETHPAPDLTRPGLSDALERLAAKEYDCLVVTRLDRLTRSPATLGTLLRMLSEREARLIVIDIGLDTGTEDGRVAAETLMTVGAIEEKTLEQGKPPGEAAGSVRRASGRPSVADRPSLKRRIADMRSSGMTLQAIADTLNAEGVPTVRGGARWRPSSVQAAAGYKRPSRARGRGE
jgi:DNA invertase Pin-like site-specific DNA recombinase